MLASQYDPLSYLTPFTTQAKILVQDLWKQEREWDNIIKTDSLLKQWQAWELELKNLPDIHFPVPCYLPIGISSTTSESHMHVFCDASERVYGAVAYLWFKYHVSFVMAKLLSSKLSIPPQSVTLWTDSTTALSWLTSDSCCYKVFGGTRIAEIQTLTDLGNWRYSKNNPADITRGKILLELSQRHRWSQGPPFLLLNANCCQ